MLLVLGEKIQLILDFIYSKCRDSFGQEMSNVNVDLTDLDGNIKFISDKAQRSRLGSDMLQPRKTYILVDLKQTTIDNKQMNQVTPLLRNSELLNSSYLTKLAQKPGVIGGANVPSGAKLQTRSTSRASNSTVIKNVISSSLSLLSSQSGSIAAGASQTGGGKPNIASSAKSALRLAKKK